MADRFFPNDFPDFVAEAEATGGDGDRPAGVRGLLSLPYATLSDRFLRAARRPKDKARPVVEETWVKAGRQVTDYTLYTGAVGTVLLLFRSFRVTGDRSV